MAKKNKDIAVEAEVPAVETDSFIDEVVEEIQEMATNICINTAEVEGIEESVAVMVEEVKEVVIEAVEATADFIVGSTVKIVGFYVRAFNGLVGVVTGIDESNNTLIELEGGTQAAFKASNLEKVK